MCVLATESDTLYLHFTIANFNGLLCERVSMNVHRIPYDFHLIHLVGGNRSRNLLFMISQLVIGAEQPNDDAN